MKLVKEHINEKFVEDSDPIHDMGIGFYCKRYFKHEGELQVWILEHLSQILEKNNIPKDIISHDHHWIRKKYYEKIKNYCEKYLFFEGGTRGVNIDPVKLGHSLLRMGFDPKDNCFYR